MTAQSLRQRLANSAERALAKAELRRRILDIVNRKQSLDDYNIWIERAPDYLPWDSMVQEIKALDQEKKLRLEIVKPGQWVIHSLEAPQAEAGKPSTESNKPTTAKSAKRSGSRAKKSRA